MPSGYARNRAIAYNGQTVVKLGQRPSLRRPDATQAQAPVLTGQLEMTMPPLAQFCTHITESDIPHRIFRLARPMDAHLRQPRDPRAPRLPTSRSPRRRQNMWFGWAPRRRRPHRRLVCVGAGGQVRAAAIDSPALGGSELSTDCRSRLTADTAQIGGCRGQRPVPFHRIAATRVERSHFGRAQFVHCSGKIENGRTIQQEGSGLAVKSRSSDGSDRLQRGGDAAAGRAANDRRGWRLRAAGRLRRAHVGQSRAI